MVHIGNVVLPVQRRPKKRAFPALYLLFLQQHQLCKGLIKTDLQDLAVSRTAIFHIYVQFILIYYLLLAGYDSIRMRTIIPILQIGISRAVEVTKLGGRSAGTWTWVSQLPAMVLFPLTLPQTVFILIFDLIFKSNTWQGEEERTEDHQRSFLHTNVVDSSEAGTESVCYLVWAQFCTATLGS